MTTVDAGRSADNQPGEPEESSNESNAIAVPESNVPDSIAALKERLQFYESFDRLINENVTRSSELLREAIDLRERTQIEGAEAQAAARRTVARERESHRDMLSSVLQDLMSLQQVTERLAQRVTDALEIVESELEPPGLAAGVTPIRHHDDDAPDLLSLSEPHSTLPPAPESAWGRADGTVDDESYEESAETNQLTTAHDAPESGASPSDPDQPEVEVMPGEGEESAPIEMDVAAWTAPSTTEEDPTEHVAVETADSEDAAEPVDADATAEPTAIESGAAEANEANTESATSTSPPQLEAPTSSEVANWFATSPAMTAPASAPSEPSAPHPEPSQSERSQPEPSRPDEAPESEAGTETELTSSPTTINAVDEQAQNDAEESATERGPFLGTEEPVEAGNVAEPLSEPRPLTLVAHNVPRTAVALSLQRYLLGLPGIQSVETREYYNGTLRFHIVARTRLSVEDLRGWAGGENAESVNEEDGLLEVRLPAAPSVESS